MSSPITVNSTEASYKPITVELKNSSYKYEIAIAPGSLSELGSYLVKLDLNKRSKKILLVSNPDILKIYQDVTLNSLQKAGFEVAIHPIPEGEVNKTFDEIEKIYNIALENRLERSSTMVALGGGVVGDMTGFAAATWLRGINFVQVPTSLLAMVDASIGGKTGVNLPEGKNLIGAFYQPSLVLIDPQVLKTLPVREFRAGIAEVIKYGVIWEPNLSSQPDLFRKLELAERLDDLAYLSEELLQTILTCSCQAKADVVSKDEKETDLRAILNYGHTIGHAIESLTKYSVVNHGEAVAIGMVAAGKMATKLQMWTEAEEKRQNKLIEKAKLLENAEFPTKIPALNSEIPALDSEKVIEEIKKDKKEGFFILPTKIGKVKKVKIEENGVSEKIIREVLTELKISR
jgi:3-dehydroquinate synthase